MKSTQWIKLVMVNLLLVAVIILPFLPGPPNRAVIILSGIAQSAGFFGLLLVPSGLIWTIIEIIKARKKEKEKHEFSLVPFYLLIIPLVAFVTRVYVTEPLSNYSRNLAIQQSKPLIAAIEEYKDKEGRYPKSLEDLEEGYLEKIPSPFVMGILDFRYNNINDSYSLSFSQWLETGALEEIVLYDKNNLRSKLTGKYASYDYDFDLCRIKGAIASYDTPHNDWRFYRVD